MVGLQGKNVLVTGGTSGIGQAIAVRFAEEGAHVAINYRRGLESVSETDEMIHQAVEACCQRIAQHGVDHIVVRADVSKEEDVVRMVGETIEKLGGVDILVNNAGIQIPGHSHEIEVGAFDRVLSINLRGAYLCAREVIRHLVAKEKPGVIINVSSVHQIIPKPRFVGYSVSKGGMQNLTRTLALEYAGRGIRVNAIGPGATITPTGLGGRSGQEGTGRGPHPDGACGHCGGDGCRYCLSLFRGSGLYHRPVPVYRRWPDAIS
jgi:glucose 1-dehydrogenase